MRIFRSVTIAVLGLAVLASTNAAQQGLTLGARGGVSVASASLDISETFSTENRTGITGGVFLNYDMGFLGFQVGGQYTQKGSTLDINQVVNDLSLAYLEIPAVVKVGLPLGLLKPSVFGGAGVSFTLSCDDAGTDCKDAVKSTDWNGIVGADVAIYLGSVSLWVDGRYHFGFSDITSAADIFGDLKNRNWTFQGGVGLGF